jgi:hypothetical protein
MPIYIGKKKSHFTGTSNVPPDVHRRRRYVSEAMNRMGTPMLVKHRFNDLDFRAGTVVKSPVYDNIYEQTRNLDPLSHGVGYMSVELSDNEWYDVEGNIAVNSVSPGAGWTKAPKYRGYGEGILTYIIEPDRAEDFFKVTTGGPVFKVQQARAIAPWYPNINDNDLLINVQVDKSGNPIETFERYEAKNVSPVSVRGLDRRGRKEQGDDNFGNSHVLNQSFDMALIPDNDVIYQVEWDR